MEQLFIKSTVRLVQGHPMKVQASKFNGVQQYTKSGQPKEECYFAVAIPKTCQEWASEILPKLQQVANGGFTHGEPSLPTFSWKYLDGDTTPDKEGFAGNWILKIKGGFPAKCWEKGGTAPIMDPDRIKCGYYIRVVVNVDANGDRGKPGLYINPSLVELVAEGPEIASSAGPDGSQFFSQAPPAVGMPGQMAPPAVGMPGQMAPPVQQAPAAPVTPDHNFVNVLIPTAKAQFTVEEYKRFGLTEDQLIQQGLFTRP